MPMIEVKLYDYRVTDESVPKMIEALTDALHESSGAAKEHINVVIQGVPPKHWGSRASPRARAMPLIEVKLFDFRMDEETSRKLIAGLTDALCEATTEGLREHTWVVVEGHSPKNWGVGGVPWPADKTPPR